MIKSILILFSLMMSFNVYAADCYVTGEDFSIQNTLTQIKSQESGQLEDCQRWKVSQGKVEVFSDYKPRIAKIGQILLPKHAIKGSQSGLLSMLSDQTDVEIAGANFAGDESSLDNLPNKGYILPNNLQFDSKQHDTGSKELFHITHFTLNKQNIKIVDNTININNLTPGNKYTWSAIDASGSKRSGYFEVQSASKLKKLNQTLKKIGASPKLSQQGRAVWTIWYLRNNGYFFDSQQLKQQL